MLQKVFKQNQAFVRNCLRMLAETACNAGNVGILDWVNQFGIELRSTEHIENAVMHGDVKMLQWFFERGFEVRDPELLELAVESGQLEVARWLVEHRLAVISLELVTIAGDIENEAMMRWLVEHGPPLDVATAMRLVFDYHYVEIALWLSEDVRQHLVLEALRKANHKVMWWILSKTQFQDGAKSCICDAIQCCPKKAQL
ncbi:hypothetical protein PHYSODRAFT_303276 [Phytophthora sojae]|uniref:Ankyrin repeat protein n=1 Tax=Phytophthora sojae (strain P6497) TaxID=1094619 RepID=G4ZQX0_PHYSP|nr:hypothetical protein PHYSODRAFT_303276 [Phytophthora sojae]EGZ13918.1 hypothetical protein PHYSODRAFT_303276 [Phytophthora sojae]|eukprot:XP_009531347.1 hypothetical protein PHYSODRAFT_303276 [Phytophthora sojae]